MLVWESLATLEGGEEDWEEELEEVDGGEGSCSYRLGVPILLLN
jgi:hypothetical protein